METEPIQNKIEVTSQNLYVVVCRCGFEAYRPMTFKIASIIAKGHEIITAHIPDIYEKKNNSTNN